MKRKKKVKSGKFRSYKSNFQTEERMGDDARLLTSLKEFLKIIYAKNKICFLKIQMIGKDRGRNNPGHEEITQQGKSNCEW